MIKQDAYGESTIAMSVYNLACQTGRPVSFDELYSLLKKDFLYTDLTEDLLERSIKELVSRKRIIQREGHLISIDQKRRQVILRDKSDVFVDEETGIVHGGWEGWILEDPRRGYISINEVVK